MQAQDTINNYAELMTAKASMMNVGYAELPQALERIRALTPDDDASVDFRMYNLMGNYLLAVAMSDWTVYTARINDVEGLRRAAVLAADLRSRGVDRNAVRQELLAAALRNPYDGQAFQWDDAAGAVRFTGLASAPRDTHLIPY